jgi:hypothetical protein
MGRSAGRHSRRSLAWGLAVWLALSAALLVRVQVARPDLVNPDFAVRLAKLRQRQTEQPGRPLGLVIGSSRLLLAYRPEVVAPLRDQTGRLVLTFNFSHPGMGPVFQHLYLRRLVREGIRPRVVVLEVMPMLLHREDDHIVQLFIPVPELPAAASYLPLATLVRGTLRRQRQVYPAAARSLFPGDLRRLVPEPCDYPTLGQGGLKNMLPRVSAAERRRQVCFAHATYPWLGDPTVSPRSARALRASVELCRRRGAVVVLLLSPEGPSFRSLYPPGVEEEIATFVRRLADESGAVAVDARRWLDEEDFYDGHHALEAGAARLTRQLHDEVLGRLVWPGGD